MITYFVEANAVSFIASRQLLMISSFSSSENNVGAVPVVNITLIISMKLSSTIYVNTIEWAFDIDEVLLSYLSFVKQEHRFLPLNTNAIE